MGFVGWPLGLFLSAISSIFGILGKLLLKLAHNERERVDDEQLRAFLDGHDTSSSARFVSPSSRMWYMYFSAGLFSMMVLNPALASIAYCFASQSLLAPMAGLTIGWNTLLGPIVLPHERLTTHDFVGALLIFTGCVLVGVSGSHDTPPLSIPELVRRFVTAPFILYTVALLALVAFLTYQARDALYLTREPSSSAETTISPVHKMRKKQLSPLARVSISVLAGISSGQLFFLAATMRVVHESPSAHIWRHPITYLCIVGAIGTALLGLYLLNAALKVEDAVVVIYLYEASYIISGAVSGLCFFQDMRHLSPWHYAVYALSLVVILLGIYTVSRRSHTLEGLVEEEENLLPLLTVPATVDDIDSHRLFQKASYFATRRSSSPTRRQRETSWPANRRKSYPSSAPQA
ncbi:hypothetical protein PINS_up019535 [Pythium insidiosum]|nr:hypothetical protein PINS_up004348 [Pythium insidiosum]GLE08374.1 hypothetical protein PINS_up019535 [Pythium insidiosum]